LKNLAIGRRYAKALLLIGKEDGQTETYRKELSGVADLFEREKALAQTICNPLYAAASREKILQEIVRRLKLSRVMSSFLLLLFAKGRIGFITGINEFYQKLADELKGVARASLVTAIGLSSETVEKIRSALATMTGKDVVLEVAEDPNLIGGIVTKIGDLILDGSIRTQLLNMRESLKRGERV
jgi:F-type H+-transporting ATPase subunit delta